MSLTAGQFRKLLENIPDDTVVDGDDVYPRPACIREHAPGNGPYWYAAGLGVAIASNALTVGMTWWAAIAVWAGIGCAVIGALRAAGLRP